MVPTVQQPSGPLRCDTSPIFVLEGEFHGELDQPRSRCADDLPKMGIIVYFSVDRCGSIELSMIENVESLQPEF